MDTTKGRILIETAPAFAPGHVARITELVRQGFYDGLTFHRVIDNFMAQGGDPEGTGRGGSGRNIQGEFFVRRPSSAEERPDDLLPVQPLAERLTNRTGYAAGMPVVTQLEHVCAEVARGEIDGTVFDCAHWAPRPVETWIAHCPGVASMARSDDRNSADSQFFLMRYMTESLDRQYSAWGRVVHGLEVVRDLQVGTIGETLRFVPDRMTEVRIAADLPEAERPHVFVLREDGPAFQELVAEIQGDSAVPPDACEVDLPAVVEDGA
ncbi:MAG: peptidylprolyl isomerase [Caulobacterales bacterium]|nr:peptidylprolyl isomerase [Caulobacterales bacterium]